MVCHQETIKGLAVLHLKGTVKDGGRAAPSLRLSLGPCPDGDTQPAGLQS